MNILICEDEIYARKHLKKLILKSCQDVKIISEVETGEEALSAIRKYDLDLIFMDIELADGSCFETLDQIKIKIPIIFTTAYSKYALKAFSLNSIDYLLKPISKQNVVDAFQKYYNLRESFEHTTSFIFSSHLIKKGSYKERFLVKTGRKLFPIHISEIAYFMSHDKMVWLITKERKRYIIDFTLSQLLEVLNPEVFFRLNRKFITSINAVQEIEPYFKGQVTVKIKPQPDEEIIISRSKTPELKKWLDI